MYSADYYISKVVLTRWNYFIVVHCFTCHSPECLIVCEPLWWWWSGEAAPTKVSASWLPSHSPDNWWLHPESKLWNICLELILSLFISLFLLNTLLALGKGKYNLNSLWMFYLGCLRTLLARLMSCLSVGVMFPPAAMSSTSVSRPLGSSSGRNLIRK